MKYNLDSESAGFSRCSLLLIALLCLLIACADALPPKHPVSEIASYSDRATEAASRAESFAEEARSEVERSNKLLKEIRELLARAEEAGKRCDTIAKKIPKQKTRIVYRYRKECKEVEKAKVDEEKKKQEEGPKYSPSDAPL